MQTRNRKRKASIQLESLLIKRQKLPLKPQNILELPSDIIVRILGFNGTRSLGAFACASQKTLSIVKCIPTRVKQKMVVRNFNHIMEKIEKQPTTNRVYYLFVFIVSLFEKKKISWICALKWMTIFNYNAMYDFIMHPEFNQYLSYHDIKPVVELQNRLKRLTLINEGEFTFYNCIKYIFDRLLEELNKIDLRFYEYEYEIEALYPIIQHERKKGYISDLIHSTLYWILLQMMLLKVKSNAHNRLMWLLSAFLNKNNNKMGKFGIFKKGDEDKSIEWTISHLSSTNTLDELIKIFPEIVAFGKKVSNGLISPLRKKPIIDLAMISWEKVGVDWISYCKKRTDIAPQPCDMLTNSFDALQMYLSNPFIQRLENILASPVSMQKKINRIQATKMYFPFDYIHFFKHGVKV